jgi:hypothetical protein
MRELEKVRKNNMWEEIKTTPLVFSFLTNCQGDFSSRGYWPLAMWRRMSTAAPLLFLMMSMFAVAHAEPLQGKITSTRYT